jgi:hypothetical protein
MTMRKKIIIFLGITIFLVLLVFFIINLVSKENIEIVEEEKIDSTSTNLFVDSGASQIEKMGEDNMLLISNSIEINEEELYTKQLAKIFVERFNTYSNQNQNNHIEEVKEIVTDSMYNWIETTKINYSENYEGLTTQVLSSIINNFSSSKASVYLSAIETSQKKIDGKIELEKKNSEFRVELVKQDGKWLVNGFFRE